MKKYFAIDTKDDFQKARIIQFILLITTFLLSFLIRSHEKTFFTFSFIFEFFILSILFNFYFRAQKNRNYAYWGISICIFIYLLRAILQYTFVDYNALILYFSFLSSIFLIINIYIMSSPLFYPRVQWWEYDFRYRGDLKATVNLNNDEYDSRVTDLRRDAVCVEVFESLNVDQNVSLNIFFENKNYKIDGTIKTITQLLPGRPFRYGVKVDLKELASKQDFNELRRGWSDSNKVKLRKKFTKIKNGN